MRHAQIPQKLKDEMRTEASQITNVAQLRAYAQRFPSLQAGHIILSALDYLSEPKVLNGKRDGKKIWQHLSLGYGLRLTGTDSLLLRPDYQLKNRQPGRDIVVAVGGYAEKMVQKPYFQTLSDKITHKKFFGTEEPEELVREFLNILADELRKRY